MYIRCRPLGVNVKSSLEHGWCWTLHIRDLVLASQQATGSLCIWNGTAITIPYSGKLSRDSKFGTIFVQKTFADCSLDPSKDVTPQNYMEKTFVNIHKTSKVFSLEIFPLYTIIPQVARFFFFFAYLGSCDNSWL